MLLRKVLLLLPMALLSHALPDNTAEPALAEPNIADAGSPPPPDSKPPNAIHGVNEESSTDATQITDCSSWYGFYGAGRWTYTEVQWCYTPNWVSQKQRNSWYYWQGSWHPGSGYRLDWETVGTVGSRHFDTGPEWNTGPSSERIWTFQNALRPGTWSVTMDYYQKGPFWGGGRPIDVTRRFSVTV